MNIVHRGLKLENVMFKTEAESCDVVRGDILNNSDFVQHNDLWNKSETLKP